MAALGESTDRYRNPFCANREREPPLPRGPPCRQRIVCRLDFRHGLALRLHIDQPAAWVL